MLFGTYYAKHYAGIYVIGLELTAGILTSTEFIFCANGVTDS